MTTTETTPATPSFPTHSLVRSVLGDLAIVALCAALVAGFLAQVWRAPTPPTELEAAAASASPARS